MKPIICPLCKSGILADVDDKNYQCTYCKEILPKPRKWKN